MGKCCSTSAFLDDELYNLDGLDNIYGASNTQAPEPQKPSSKNIAKNSIDVVFELPNIFNWTQFADSDQCVAEHSDCLHIQRILFLFSIFYRYQASNIPYSSYRFVNADFKYYSDTHLINDYIHIVQKHLKDHNETFIENLFNDNNQCNANQCSSANRLLLERIIDFEDSKIESAETEEIVSINILDTIHCNLCHSEYMKQQLTVKSIPDKFKTNGELGEHTQNIKCSSWGIGEYNNYYYTEAMRFYQFAPKFDYDYDLSWSSNISYFRQRELLEISPKHSSLKDEALNNQIMTINVSEWDFVELKAQRYLQSVYAQKNCQLNNRVQHNLNLVWSFSGKLELDHIICLLLICNFKSLSNAIRNSYCRRVVDGKKKKKEKDDVLKERHCEYYHIAKQIKICVELFGIVDMFYSNDTTDKCLYHSVYNVSDCEHFDWFRVKWNYPISTSSTLQVFNKKLLDDTDSNGVVLELHRNDGCYFDCGWISRFLFEKEILFIDCKCSKKFYSSYGADKRKKQIITVPLPINNMLNIDNKSNDKMKMKKQINYIGAIHAFIEIINEAQLPPNQHCDRFTKIWINRPRRYVDQMYQNSLIQLIQHRFILPLDDNNVISIYAKNAIDSFLKETKKYCIDIRLFMKEHQFLTKLFFRNSNEKNKIHKRLNIQFISYLFPNCTEIKVHHIEELGNIDKSFMFWLFNELNRINESHEDTEDIYDDESDKRYELLMNGYIREQNMKYNIFIPHDVIGLILSFYPNIYSAINKICFMNSVDTEKKQLITTEMIDFVPKHWNIEVTKTTFGGNEKETMYCKFDELRLDSIY